MVATGVDFVDCPGERIFINNLISSQIARHMIINRSHINYSMKT